MATIREGIPARLVRGHTLEFLQRIADATPATHSADLALVTTDDVVNVAGSDNGDGRFLFELGTAASDDLHVGTYRYQIAVTETATSKVRLVEQGVMEVDQNFALVTDGHDGRTHAEKVLAALEAVLENKAGADQANMAVDGQSLSRYSWPELVELHRRYEFRVARERDQQRTANGLPTRLTRQVRFTR